MKERKQNTEIKKVKTKEREDKRAETKRTDKAQGQ